MLSPGWLVVRRWDAIPRSLTTGTVVHYSPWRKRNRRSASMSTTRPSEKVSPSNATARAKNLALLLLAMTQFVIVIDASIVNVALPSIGAHLHFARDDLSWVVNSY